MRPRHVHWFCGMILMAAALPQAFAADRYQKIAERYAPIVFQANKSVKLDQITGFDFDGDWNGANNWDNAYLYPTPGKAYYAVIEGDRHYFLFYAFFHARDYTSTPMESFAPKVEHENDMEGMMLIVDKEYNDSNAIVYMETLAHDRFYKYVGENYSDIRPLVGRIDGRITLEEYPAGSGLNRPCVFIEAEGHGVFDLRAKYTGDPASFAGNTYRPAGRGAGIPRHAADADVSYSLIPIEDTLWARREDIGSQSTYCCAGEFVLSGGRAARFGASFNGPIGGCSAKPPWGWDDPTDGSLPAGDWFLNPIKAVGTHVEIPEFSTRYISNPYFQGKTVDVSENICSTQSQGKAIEQSALKTAMGIGQILLSGGLDRKSVGSQARGLFLKELVLLEWGRQQELTQWEFIDQLSRTLVDDGRLVSAPEQTRLTISGQTTVKSPVFSAPQRFYRWLVMSYRSDRPLKLTLRWQNEGQTAFDEAQISKVYQIPAAADWNGYRIDLAELPGWKAGITTTKLEMLVDLAQAASGKANLELQYLVLDRSVFADTLSAK